jgi:Protein of unknown function (DUF1579)
MKPILSLCVTVALLCSAIAQDKPGAEHDVLKAHEGNWTTTMKMGGTETKGVASYKMTLGGLWLESTFEGEVAGAKFTGKGMDTYDATKKKYVSIWCDSMSTTPMTLEGTYDKDKKTMTMEGTGPGMEGPKSKFKSVTVMKDADTIDFTMYMGDAKEPAFTIEYKRKK